MHLPYRNVLASLLIAAVLAVPTGASAESMPVTKPGVSAPAQPGDAAGLVTPKLTRDEAITIARNQFPIPAELGEPNVGIQQSQEGAFWTLEWISSAKQQQNQVRISVGINAVTGQITAYSYWSSEQEASLQLSLTRSEAQAKAREWMQKLVPAEYQSSLRYQESPLNAGYWGGAAYNFNWVREVEGYPYAGNGVTITVDARTGAVTQYSLNWKPNVKLTVPETVLTQAAAEEAYRKLSMELQYQRFQKRGTDEAEWRLVYRPASGGFPRMDQTGTLLNWDGSPMDLSKLMQYKLVPASEKSYQKPAQPLEQEQALAIAQAITGRKDAPTFSNYSEYGDESKRRSWEFSWTLEGERGMRSEQRVRVDAETGLVVEFSNWSELKAFDKGEKAPVSFEQALEKASEFVRTYRPDLAGNVRMTTQMPEWYAREGAEFTPVEYYISLQQVKNGIPVLGRELSLNVDARTGAVRQFWSGWWDEQKTGEFPTPDPGVTAQQAMNLYLRHQGIELAWVTFWNPEKGQESQPALMWQPAGTLNVQLVDAKSGAPLDWEGRNLVEAMRFPSDIKGHPAEREIELLWVRGVFDLQDGKFNPDMVISADELARWIVLARGMRPYMAYDFAMMKGMGGVAAEQAARSSNSAYFGAALQSGIILPEDLATIADLNGPVSRELFALWSVRAMGYGRIATMPARIEMKFADKDTVGARYQNAVALLAGLNIVSGDKFNPQGWLTRGQAAKILFAVSSR